MKTLLVSVGSLLLLAGAATQVGAQAFSAQQHSQFLASAFTKGKDNVNDRGSAPSTAPGDVSSQPWLADEPYEYAGTYAVGDLGFVITVEVLHAGNLRLIGTEPAPDGLSPDRRVFFYGVNVQDGLLTATKVDEFGLTYPFQAAFLTQSRNGEVRKGMGTKLAQPMELNGLVLEKLFYQKRP